MPPKLKKAAPAADGGPSVLDRIKAQKAGQAEQAAPAPAAPAKRSLKAKQILELDGKGPLDVLGLLNGVRSGEVKWCRKCADLFNPQASDTQQCPRLHPNFTYVKPSPELKSQLEEAEARITKAAMIVQGGARGRATRRLHGPAGRAATRVQCAARRRAAKRSAQCQRARRRIKEGESELSARNWEAAIEKFKAGLAVEGTRDDDLTTLLRTSLDGAESSLAARDAAREQAEEHLVEATSFTSSRDYPKAIDALQVALELDTQSDDIKARLQESLASAETVQAAVESAKHEAAEYVSTGQGCMSSHDYNGAIAAYQAAMALDVNDGELAASFQDCLTAARDALAAAVDTARGRLAD
jgi:tetratricopeptide (TPR) repeat protein